MGRKRHELAIRYEKGELNAVPISNCSLVFSKPSRRFPGTIDQIVKTQNEYRVILVDNREAFRTAWGPMDFAYKGSEFHFHCWVREFEGEKFIILTAKGKGTAMEMVCPHGTYSATIKYMDDRATLIRRFITEVAPVSSAAWRLGHPDL